MAKIYGLSAADRKLIIADHNRLTGGGTSQRPIAKRRRGPRGGGTPATPLRWAEVVSGITAGTWALHGTGTVQLKKLVDGELVDDGDPITVNNWWPREFIAGWYAKIDMAPDTPEVLVATCVPA